MISKRKSEMNNYNRSGGCIETDRCIVSCLYPFGYFGYYDEAIIWMRLLRRWIDERKSFVYSPLVREAIRLKEEG